MKYEEAMEYMQSLNQYGIVPGLGNVEALCARLNSPEKELKFVHIAGTNGKGSVLAYVSTILKCAGYRVGRYISPTIFDYRERIQVGERKITKKDLCEGAQLMQTVCNRMVEEGLPHPTAFEVETALAFWYFRKMKCGIVVLETGMGGKGDATNVIADTVAAVFASISMDHMKFLGSSLSAIAGEKAGIMKAGCRAVTVKQQPEVMEVLKAAAEEKNCPLTTADCGLAGRIRYGVEKQRFDYEGLKDLEIGLAGTWQVENAVLALETVKALGTAGYSVSEAALRRGLREARWPGRFTVIGRKPLFVADGAHNEDAARKLAQSIEFYFTNKRIIYIMGMLQDKEYEKIIRLTHAYADQIITVTPPDNPRGMRAYDLAREVAKVHPQVSAVDSLEEAVEMSYLLAGKEDVILAFGSLSYLGSLMTIVEKRNSRGARK